MEETAKELGRLLLQSRGRKRHSTRNMIIYGIVITVLVLFLLLCIYSSIVECIQERRAAREEEEQEARDELEFEEFERTLEEYARS